MKNVENIVKDLISIEVDGETMEYILRKVGMEKQMLRQLFLQEESNELIELFKEKQSLEGINYEQEIS